MKNPPITMSTFFERVFAKLKSHNLVYFQEKHDIDKIPQYFI